MEAELWPPSLPSSLASMTAPGPDLSGMEFEHKNQAKFCELNSGGRDSGKAEAVSYDRVTSAQPESQLEANLTPSKIF